MPTMTSPSTRTRSSRRCTDMPGFTVVEILIVVVILAILAAIVMPQFTSATEEARENALITNLWRIRQQIELYQQHHGEYPRLAQFAEQMTMATNNAGETAPAGTAGYVLGPYLTRIPTNPYTGSNIIGDGEVGTSDWHYDQTTGAFHANHSEEHREL